MSRRLHRFEAARTVARLSYDGLPCPNLGTGGYAFHGPFEHITAEGMDVAVQIALGIIEKYAKK